MKREEIVKIVEAAVTRVIENQPELLELNVAERVICHHLARQIADLIPYLDVDVEYNRHGIEPKRLWLPLRKALQGRLYALRVFPDVLVHKRNSDAQNLLVLEVKKPGESVEYDNLKLMSFRRELNYEHAAHLILGFDPAGHLVCRLEWVD